MLTVSRAAEKTRMSKLYAKALAAGLAVAAMSTQGAVAQTRSSSKLLRSVNKNPIVKEGVREPGAIDALKQMSAYLTSASTLGITSQGSLDVVTADGQRVQPGGTAR